MPGRAKQAIPHAVEVAPGLRWHPTHTVGGIKVMKVANWTKVGRGKGFPAYFTEEGKRTWPAKGKPAYPIPETEEVRDYGVKPQIIYPTAEEKRLRDFEPRVSLSLEITQAIFRAAAWPTPAECSGFAETAGGSSVTVVGRGLVRVYDHQARKHYLLRVPEQVTFDAVDEEAMVEV